MNYILHSPIGTYASLLSLFVFTLICAFLNQYELGIQDGNSALSVFFMFDLFFIELILVLLSGYWFLRKNSWVRIISYLLTFLFMVIYFSQFLSFFIGGSFLTPLALSNVNHIGLIMTDRELLLLLIFFVMTFSFFFIVERKIRKKRRQKEEIKTRGTILLVCIALLLMTDKLWLPDTILTQRQTLFETNFQKHTAPVLAFLKIYPTKKRSKEQLFTSQDLVILTKNDFYLNMSSDFPLIKKTLYKENLPLFSKKARQTPPNIIIFFTEGFSARSLQAYGCKYKDLTPNLDGFAKESMVVHNYYNHTAATYRGLLGQLCSIYPTHGGSSKGAYKNLQGSNFLSLNKIFEEKGYTTVFFDAHHKDKAVVNDLAINLGFKDVYTGLPLAKKYLNGAHLQARESLSDKQFLTTLREYLKENEKNSMVNETADPFFLCLYNLGTHALTKLTKDGKEYKPQNNVPLDRIHNFDDAFGRFWDYFKNSSYRDNTVIIFTADHCHYPEKDFVKAFPDKGYQHLFIDTIPLIIFDSTQELPQTFDANYATSIDFAPSLLHYLAFSPFQENPFMGRSIFSTENQRKHFGVASFDKGVYLITKERIYKNDSARKYHAQFKAFEKYIFLSQQLEVSGKLWEEQR